MMKYVYWLLVGVVVAAVVWQAGLGDEMKFVNLGKSGGSGSRVMAAGFGKGGEWINSEGVELGELLADEKTKAVLVDFWTYSCINCQRTLPYLKAWWEKYEDKGLVIVGVHTPEFEFEKEYDNVVAASKKYGVGWPVVQDNDYGIWRDYDNHYWPHKYLVNKAGEVVYDHIGEGGYEETEREILKLLGMEGSVTEEPARGSVGFGMRQTPELYVTKRGQASGHLGKGKDQVELVGEWSLGEDYSEAGKGARLGLDFAAGEVNLVMSLEGDDAGGASVVVDGSEPVEVEVVGDDLYELWRGEFGRHRMEMEFKDGTRIHAFTFGR